MNTEMPRSVLVGRPRIENAGGRSYMSVPILAHGDLLGAITFGASKHRQYNESDLELAEELADRAALSIENARLYRRANEALDARDEFLSIAAHEIRGPIASIHLAVQTLRQGRETNLPRLLEMIEREGRRLARFVDELLDVGRIRSGRIHFELKEVDLAAIIREVSTRLGPDLAVSGSSLSVASEGPVIGHWDSARLDQVVTNLFSTRSVWARKTHRSHGAIETRPGVPLVKDHGLGIPTRCIRESSVPSKGRSRVATTGGSALVSYIVRTIVEGLGGEVRLESGVSIGSTFIIGLPQTASA